jgi:hypothetical protein
MSSSLEIENWSSNEHSLASAIENPCVFHLHENENTVGYEPTMLHCKKKRCVGNMQYQNSHDAASSLQQYISEAVSKNSTHNKRPNVGQGRLEQTDLVGQGRRPISICQKLGHRL